MQQLTSLFRSYAFRRVFLAICLVAGSGIVTLAFVYWRTSTLITQNIDNSLRDEMFELAQRFRDSGLSALTNAIAVRTAGAMAGKSKYLVVDPRSKVLVGRIAGWPQPIRDLEKWADGVTIVGTSHDGNGALIRFLGAPLPGGYRLAIERDMTEWGRFKKVIEEAILGGLVLTLILGVCCGILVTRRLLGRLDKVNATTERIMGGKLNERIPLDGSGDEFDQAAANLNRMLDQIAQLVSGMREVTDNVAHDLRHPLARLRNHLEMAMTCERGGHDLRNVLQKGIDEADKILETFNALLCIAQLESGTVSNSLTTVDLSTVATDAAELYEPLCEQRGLMLSMACEAGVEIIGSRDLLSQAAVNILDNAVKYTPAGGTIAINVGQDSAGSWLIVSDTGPGIPEDKQEAVLSRFVRLDESRSTPGTGLGLSLVAAIAGFHGAILELDDNDPGLIVRLAFPERKRRTRRGDG